MANNQINGLRQNLIGQLGQSANTQIGRRPDASFGALLNEQLNKNSPLQFSRHAKERMNERSIELSPSLLNNLNDAVSKARSKGARDVVVIDLSSARGAFIVNVPNNTVVTTISQSDLKNNIFTNIDSAVLI